MENKPMLSQIQFRVYEPNYSYENIAVPTRIKSLIRGDEYIVNLTKVDWICKKYDHIEDAFMYVIKIDGVEYKTMNYTIVHHSSSYNLYSF